MTGNKGLGRGLDALLGGVREAEEQGVDSTEVKMVPIDQIIPNPYQPRREFSEESLADLSASIKAQGVLQPILVRPLEGGQYELVAGERRHRASRMAGLDEMPALVRELSNQESLAIALIENLQREDLNPIEEALGYQQLQREFGLNQEELSTQVGKSRSAVANAMRLLNLPDGVQKDIEQGVISAGHGRALMTISDPDVLADLHKRIKENGLTVRQVESQAGFWKQNGRLPGAGDEVVPPSASKTTTAKKADPWVLHLQSLFAEETGLTTKIACGEGSGKVTFSFKDRDELINLAEQLGVSLNFDIDDDTCTFD